jgi:hypothetical protein
LNDVPLVIRGEEVGRVTVTARVWPRDELIQSRKKEVQGGFDPGGGLGVGGNGEGAWMLSAMATDMIDKQAALDDALARLESSERRVENLKFDTRRLRLPGSAWRVTTGSSGGCCTRSETRTRLRGCRRSA